MIGRPSMGSLFRPRNREAGLSRPQVGQIISLPPRSQSTAEGSYAVYSQPVKILQGVSRALGRINRSLGSAEGTTGGTPGLTPGLRHVEAAEREEFPPEEFVADEQEETE